MSSDISRSESPLVEYDESVNIIDYPSSFNLLESDDRPDIRVSHINH